MLSAFFNFNEFVSQESMSFLVDRGSGFPIGCLYQAEYFACRFLEPIFQVLHTVLFLNRKTGVGPLEVAYLRNFVRYGKGIVRRTRRMLGK